MENEGAIIRIEVADLSAAACAVDVYKAIKDFLTGEDIHVSTWMSRDNRRCSISLTGCDVRITNPALLRKATMVADCFVHSSTRWGYETYEFVFELLE